MQIYTKYKKVNSTPWKFDDDVEFDDAKEFQFFKSFAGLYELKMMITYIGKNVLIENEKNK